MRPLAHLAIPVVIATALCGGAIASAATHRPTPGRYAGVTSERGGVAFRVSKDRRSIVGFRTLLGYNGKCGQGGGPGLTAAARRIRIDRHGRFRVGVTLTFPQNPRAVRPSRGTIAGRVLGATVRGSVVERGNAKCYSETFSARRVAR